VQFKQFKMSPNSLFAILLRSSFWISFAIAVALALAARFILPGAYGNFAASIAIPFVIIGVIVAWKQREVPSDARIASTVEAVSAMSWRDFSALIEQAFQRDGYVVTRTTGAADFMLLKAGRTSLVSCKRWKAASLGLEPLRELEAERQAQEARGSIYVCTGNVSDNARRFAADHKIVLMQELELTRLLRLPRKATKSKA
jgi:restriction system protein